MSLRIRSTGGVAILLATFVLAAAAMAHDARMHRAEALAEIVLDALADMTIAHELCGTGDPATVTSVVTAIDRRYRRCAAKDPSWTELLGDLEPMEKQALAQGSSRSIGSFALQEIVKSRGTAAAMQGPAAFCARRPPAELEAFVRSLGAELAWIEAACDEFWPPFTLAKK